MIICVLVIVTLAGVGIGAYAQTTQTATPPPAAAPAPSPSLQSPPPFQSLRYEEDWSYLKDESMRSEWLDGMKYIPLNNRGWYLSLGGEARLRYEYFDQFNFGLGPQDDDGYLLQRYLLHADAHFGKRVRVFTQLQSAIGSGRNGGPRLTDDDRLEAHQAFLDLKFGNEGKSLTVRVGRHEMDFGSGRLISAGEGLNVRRSFDGLRLIYRQGPWLANGQVNKLVSVKRGLFNDGPDPSQTFWGVGATRSRPKIGGGHQFAYIALDRKRGAFDQGSGREIRHTVIARTFGASGNAAGQLDYNFDTIFQWGSFSSAGREIGVRAWALAADLGQIINRIPLKPRLGLRADATSGDRDPNDQRLQTFNPLFPGTAYSDTIGLIGAANSLALNPNMRFSVKERWTVSAGTAFFWRQSTRDGIYGINVAPLRTGQQSRARQVGTLPSVRLDWRISRHLTYTTIYSHFFAGKFLKETPPGEDVNYASTWLTFRF
jgi:Alginate export